MKRVVAPSTGQGDRRRTFLTLLLLASCVFAVPATANAAVAGGLRQIAGVKGCLSDDVATPSGCENVRGMQDVGDVVVSPDGKNVYATSVTKDAIAAFTRNESTGALTQKTSVTGCYTSTAAVATSDQCSLVPSTTALDQARGIEVSPDNKSVYVVTDTGKLSAFDRATDGTLSFNMVNGFTGGKLSSVAVSPDGATVYPAGQSNGGEIGVYARSTTPGPTLGDISFKTCFAVVALCSQPAVPTMQAVADIKVTPDNKQVLLAMGHLDTCCNWTVLGFDRVTAAGATQGDLTPPTTANRCITGNSSIAPCQFLNGMPYPRGLALNPNGSRILVAGRYAITTIDRTPSTNALAPETSSGCFQYIGAGFTGCTDSLANFAEFSPGRTVAMTPDGQNVFFGTGATGTNASIHGFTSAGALSAKPKPFGCANATPVGGCAQFRSGTGLERLVAAKGNRHVYGVGGSRLYSFALDRPPVCANIGVTTAQNTAAAVGLSCSDPDGDPVTYEIVSAPARGSLGGISGSSVNYGPLVNVTGGDSFIYRGVAGGIASDPATVGINIVAGGGGNVDNDHDGFFASQDCNDNNPSVRPNAREIPGNDIDENCDGIAVPFPRVTSTILSSFGTTGAKTTIDKLTVNNATSDTTTRVTCKGGGCPFKSKKGPKAKGGKINLLKLFGKKRTLRAGATMDVLIMRPKFIGKVVRYQIRNNKSVKRSELCLKVGSTKPRKSCG